MKSRNLRGDEAYARAQEDYLQDRCENGPFASIGGLASRCDPKRPSYIDPHDWPTYLLGYTDAAHEDLGHEWSTVAFGWSPAVVINEPRCWGVWNVTLRSWLLGAAMTEAEARRATDEWNARGLEGEVLGERRCYFEAKQEALVQVGRP